MNDKNRVCPVERSYGLDNVFRRWLAAGLTVVSRPKVFLSRTAVFGKSRAERGRRALY